MIIIMPACRSLQANTSASVVKWPNYMADLCRNNVVQFCAIIVAILTTNRKLPTRYERLTSAGSMVKLVGQAMVKSIQVMDDANNRTFKSRSNFMYSTILRWSLWGRWCCFSQTCLSTLLIWFSKTWIWFVSNRLLQPVGLLLKGRTTMCWILTKQVKQYIQGSVMWGCHMDREPSHSIGTVHCILIFLDQKFHSWEVFVVAESKQIINDTVFAIRPRWRQVTLQRQFMCMGRLGTDDWRIVFAPPFQDGLRCSQSTYPMKRQHSLVKPHSIIRQKGSHVFDCIYLCRYHPGCSTGIFRYKMERWHSLCK